MGKQWKEWETYEIKRWLLLGRKAMTNLDSILKSRDITLLTKVHIVKIMVFSSSHVWMWELEKKAEHQGIDAFEQWCWRRLLRVPWTARRSNQSILKEISPEYSLEGLMLMLKLQYFGHLMQRTDPFEKTLMLGKIEGRRSRGQRGWDGWMVSRTQGHESEWTPGVGDGQGGLACGSPWGRKVLDMTERLNLSEPSHTTKFHTSITIHCKYLIQGHYSDFFRKPHKICRLSQGWRWKIIISFKSIANSRCCHSCILIFQY